MGPGTLNLKFRTFVALATTLLASQALAQNFVASQVDFRDAATLSVQEKANELFDDSEYKRAYFIYLTDLAPIGDKYAQYMVGFMTLHGLGVAEDPVTASAWYRLAAERKTPEFIAVRDDVLRRLDSADMQRSDEIYSRLRLKFSDIVVHMHGVRRNFEELHGETTGSRITGSSSPVMIVRPRDGTGMSAEAYSRQLHNNMQKHLDYIGKAMGTEPLDAELSAAELHRLEEQVQAFAAKVDDL